MSSCDIVFKDTFVQQVALLPTNANLEKVDVQAMQIVQQALSVQLTIPLGLKSVATVRYIIMWLHTALQRNLFLQSLGALVKVAAAPMNILVAVERASVHATTSARRDSCATARQKHVELVRNCFPTCLLFLQFL